MFVSQLFQNLSHSNHNSLQFMDQNKIANKQHILYSLKKAE